MAKSYFSDQECRNVGFSEPMIRTLRQLADFVDTVNTVIETQNAQAATDAAVNDLQASQDTQDLSLASLDMRVAAIETLEPFVRQDQGAAWTAATGTASRSALASYGGQTVSNPPTQAEVQAIDNAAKAMSQALVALITDLKANGSLS